MNQSLEVIKLLKAVDLEAFWQPEENASFSRSERL
jgi:hypothetical protein